MQNKTIHKIFGTIIILGIIAALFFFQEASQPSSNNSGWGMVLVLFIAPLFLLAAAIVWLVTAFTNKHVLKAAEQSSTIKNSRVIRVSITILIVVLAIQFIPGLIILMLSAFF